MFIIVYSVFAGIAQGGYVLPLYCCWRYFEPKEKAKVAGVLLSAYALAPIPNSFLALKIINPHNVKEQELPDGRKFFPDDVAKNLPHFLKVFSIMIFCLGFLGVFFIKEPIEVKEIDGREDKAFTLLTTEKSSLEVSSGLNSSEMGRVGRRKRGVNFKKSTIRKMRCSDLKIFKDKHFSERIFHHVN